MFTATLATAKKAIKRRSSIGENPRRRENKAETRTVHPKQIDFGSRKRLKQNDPAKATTPTVKPRVKVKKIPAFRSEPIWR
jgi:hypothetical protein